MQKRVAWGLAAIAVVAVLVGLVVVGVEIFKSSKSVTATSECTVPGAPAGTTPDTGAGAAGPVFLAAVQLQHASTINAVGMARGLPQRARVIALATAFQESGLRNLPSGDRDSVGLFQQRHSQGWGTRAQILDPVYAAGKFYDALTDVKGWQQLSLTKAAQAVQYSAFPDAYAKWEAQATTLARALGGSTPLGLSCVAGAQAPTADAPQRKALGGTAAAPPALAAVLEAAQAELGGLRILAITGSTATVTVTVPGTAAAQAGRALAAWAVAHGTGFAVTAISVDDQSWTDHGWGTAGADVPAGRVAITTG